MGNYLRSVKCEKISKIFYLNIYVGYNYWLLVFSYMINKEIFHFHMMKMDKGYMWFGTHIAENGHTRNSLTLIPADQSWLQSFILSSSMLGWADATSTWVSMVPYNIAWQLCLGFHYWKHPLYTNTDSNTWYLQGQWQRKICYFVSYYKRILPQLYSKKCTSVTYIDFGINVKTGELG